MTIPEKEINVVPSLSPASAPRAFILDGMALIQTVIPGDEATFGEMNGRYSTLRQNNCIRLDLIFD